MVRKAVVLTMRHASDLWRTALRSNPLVGAIAVTLAVAPGDALAQWKPERNVEIVVGTAPGSGIETQARHIQKLLTEKGLVDTSVAVVNKPGGGNSVSVVYVNEHPGDGHYLVMTALQLLTNSITGVNPITYTDVTPLALIGQQSIGAAVRADSPIESGTELAEALKKDPQSLSIGLASSRGSGTHIGFALAMQSQGVDVSELKIVVFSSSSEAMTALLGGHVDVVTAPTSAIQPHLAAGTVRVLGVGTEERLTGDFADVPTWKEQGIDSAFGIPYAVAGPKGMTEEQIAFWDNVFQELFSSEEWRQVAEATQLDDTHLNSQETGEYWERNYKTIEAVLNEIGVAGN